MRLVLFGSGIFGVPTFRALSAEHEILMVVSQPDRPAGRGRSLQPTPVSQWARDAGLPCMLTDDVNSDDVVHRLESLAVDALVVIAFGQKLGPGILVDRFAINLHASILPAYRGAAPINWAIIHGVPETGLSVIMLADRIDAGDLLGTVTTPIDPCETAGDLHDRLAVLGPDLVESVLSKFEQGSLDSRPQDAAKVTLAPKFSRADGTVAFDQSAITVRNRIHGLTPWPGCDVLVGDRSLRLLRARASDLQSPSAVPGQVLEDGRIACADGSLELLEVRPPGGRSMPFTAWLRGQQDLADPVMESRPA